MKNVLTIIFYLSTFLSFSQNYKGADKFNSQIDSCNINNIRFSKKKEMFYLQVGPNLYLEPMTFQKFGNENDWYLSFVVFSPEGTGLVISIQRVNKNLWYYEESNTINTSIEGFFSLNTNKLELAFNIDNYEIESDSSNYYDTLNLTQKQKGWLEETKNFTYSGNYNNDKKTGEWELANFQYTYIPLKIETFENNNLVKDSIVKTNSITTKQYFYGSWKIGNHLNDENPYLVFNRNYESRINFEKNIYHYTRLCAVGPKATNYKWGFNKQNMTLVLDDKIYKIIYNTRNEFVLVEIENPE